MESETAERRAGHGLGTVTSRGIATARRWPFGALDVSPTSSPPIQFVPCSFSRNWSYRPETKRKETSRRVENGVSPVWKKPASNVRSTISAEHLAGMARAIPRTIKRKKRYRVDQQTEDAGRSQVTRETAGGRGGDCGGWNATCFNPDRPKVARSSELTSPAAAESRDERFYTVVGARTKPLAGKRNSRQRIRASANCGNCVTRAFARTVTNAIRRDSSDSAIVAVIRLANPTVNRLDFKSLESLIWKLLFETLSIVLSFFFF